MPLLSPDDWKTILTVLALGVSLVSLWFTRRSWLQSNRPIVSATVETHTGGNESIAYNLVVNNTGNRPAVNVQLCANTDLVEKCMASWVQDFRSPHTTYSLVIRCFSKDAEIPLLRNGKSMTNSFGYTRNDDQTFWVYGANLPITIRYSDLEGHKYSTSQVLRIKDSTAFADDMWETRENDF